MPYRIQAYTLKNLVICEGPEDKEFFDRLIEANNLPPRHVETTADTRTSAGGNSRFGQKLRSVRVARGFQNINNIILITDADRDADRAFNMVAGQVAAAGFLRPSAPMVKTSGRPSIAIMTIPPGMSEGNLECCCVEAARVQDNPLADNVDCFMDLAHIANGPNYGKLWLRINISARANDPFVFLRHVFERPELHSLIPLGDRTFQPIVNALSSLISAPSEIGSSERQFAASSVQPDERRDRNPPRIRKRRPPGQSQ